MSGNLAHILYLNDQGSTGNPGSSPLFLGVYPNDAARDAITPLLYGNTVIVTNSAQASSTPAMYSWNGTAWVLMSSAALLNQIIFLINNSYTSTQVNNLFANLGFYPPVANVGGLASLVAMNGYVVAVQDNGDGKPALYQYSGTLGSWVVIADVDWAGQLTTLLNQFSALDTRLQAVEHWQTPVADLSALAGVTSPRNSEMRLVRSALGGMPQVYRYNTITSQWQAYQAILRVAAISGLSALNTGLNNEGTKNAIVFVEADKKLYWYNYNTPAWEAITSLAGGGSGVVSSIGSQNYLQKVTGATTLGNSKIFELFDVTYGHQVIVNATTSRSALFGIKGVGNTNSTKAFAIDNADNFNTFQITDVGRLNLSGLNSEGTAILQIQNADQDFNRDHGRGVQIDMGFSGIGYNESQIALHISSAIIPLNKGQVFHSIYAEHGNIVTEGYGSRIAVLNSDTFPYAGYPALIYAQQEPTVPYDFINVGCLIGPYRAGYKVDGAFNVWQKNIKFTTQYTVSPFTIDKDASEAASMLIELGGTNANGVTIGNYANSAIKIRPQGASALNGILYHAATTGAISVQAITTTEISYLLGLTSNVQAQINNIIANVPGSNYVLKAGDTMTGTLYNNVGIDTTVTAGTDYLLLGQNNAEIISLGRTGNTSTNLYGTAINLNTNSLNVSGFSGSGSRLLTANASGVVTTLGSPVPVAISATLNFPSTAPQSSSDLTISYTGASVGDVVALGVDNSAVLADTSFTAWVSAAAVITVRFNNYSSSTKDPASATFSVMVVKF